MQIAKHFSDHAHVKTLRARELGLAEVIIKHNVSKNEEGGGKYCGRDEENSERRV